MTTPVDDALDDIEMAATYQPDGDYTMPFSVELLEAAKVLSAALAERNATIARLRAAAIAVLEGDADGLERLRAALERKE